MAMANANNPANEKKGGKDSEELGIIRMAGRDINGNFRIVKALMQIKGIGYNMAHGLSLAIERSLGIPASTKIGSLSDEQIDKVEQAMKEPLKGGLPKYVLNRQKDYDSGADLHVVGTDLIVANKQDIDRDIKLQTWRGFRHMYGQRVRGQRTRSTGRTGTTVGVSKSKVAEAAKPAPKAAPGAPGKPGAAAAPAAGAAPAAAPAGAAPAAKPAAAKPAAPAK